MMFSELLNSPAIQLTLIGDDIKINAPKGALTTDIVEKIKSHKKELIECLKNDGVTDIPIATKKNYYNLSSAQLRLYLIQQLNPSSTNYNIPQIFEFIDEPSVDKLKLAFEGLIQRHECLRTNFTIIDGEIVQSIESSPSIKIGEYSITQIELPRILHDFVEPFNLEKAPLLKLGIVYTDAGKNYLLWDMHHIISDGITNNILLNDLIKLCNQELLEPIKQQYKDFSEWQNNIFFNSLKFHKQLAYWQNQFNNEIAPLNWPMDYKRNEIIETKGDHIDFTISKVLTQNLIEFSNKNHATLNASMFAVFSLYIAYYCKQYRFSIGTLVAGRNHPDLNSIAGNFANFLPVGIDINKEENFTNHLQKCKDYLINAYENQDIPFEKIAQNIKSNSKFSKNRNPLFDTMLVFHNEIDEDSFLGQNIFKSVNFFENNGAKLDVKLDVYKKPTEDIKCTLEYNTALFSKDTILEFNDYFKKFIETAVNNSEEKIKDLKVFPNDVSEKLLKKQILNFENKSTKNTFKINITSSFTDAQLDESLKWWMSQYNKKIDVDFSPYNQVFQELANDESTLNTNTGANIMLLRFEDWLKDFIGDEASQINFVQENYNKLINILMHNESKTPFIFGVFPVSENIALKARKYISALTNEFVELLSTRPNFYPIDLRELGILYTIKTLYDNISFQEAHIPFTEEAFAAIGTEIFRKINAVTQPIPYKVIVLDCDNTLWEGVCGEDGAESVLIDDCFVLLQNFMLKKYNEGFLLTLCSKNNEKDVWEVFKKNPNMTLKKEHITAHQINWNHKSDNIKELAKELNVGVDSFIFIDDNIAECHEVMHNCPEVLTLHLPSDKKAISCFLEHTWAFDKVQVTDEDIQRNEMYKAETKRKVSFQKSISLEDYLKDLDLELSVGFTKENEVSRVSQLSQRTNQFNLSTIRYSENEIKEFVKNVTNQCWSVHVKDKYGDYGLTGVIVTKEQDENLILESFMLSCRVLGRGAEDAVIYALKTHCVEKNLAGLMARYIKTEKNEPIKNYLSSKWKQTHKKENLIDFQLGMNSVKSEPNHIKIYFQKDLPKVEKPFEAIKNLENDENKHHTNNQKINYYNWELNLANEENLLHKKDYFPLRYHTAESVVKAIKNTINVGNKHVEIESALQNLEYIEDCILHRDNGTLKAYYTSKGMISIMKLRKEIKDIISDSKILPNEYLKVNSFPRKNNGEIDRAAFINSIVKSGSSQKPKTEVEKQIAIIWKEVLNVNNIGLLDNFFDLGGNSLLIIKVISKMHTVFNEKPEFSDFLNQTLAKFASSFEERLIEKKTLQVQD